MADTESALATAKRIWPGPWRDDGILNVKLGVSPLELHIEVCFTGGLWRAIVCRDDWDRDDLAEATSLEGVLIAAKEAVRASVEAMARCVQCDLHRRESAESLLELAKRVWPGAWNQERATVAGFALRMVVASDDEPTYIVRASRCDEGWQVLYSGVGGLAELARGKELELELALARDRLATARAIVAAL